MESPSLREATLECTSVIIAKVFEAMVLEYTRPFLKVASL
jgi:hypothetical protein